MKKLVILILVAMATATAFADTDQDVLNANRFIKQTERQIDEARAAGNTARVARLCEARDSAIVKHHINRYLKAPCPHDFATQFEDSKVYLDKVTSKRFAPFVRDYRPMVEQYPRFTNAVYAVINSNTLTNALNDGKPLRATEAENLRTQLKNCDYYKYYVTRNNVTPISIPYLDDMVTRVYCLIDDMEVNMTTSTVVSYTTECADIMHDLKPEGGWGAVKRYTASGVTFEMVEVLGGTFDMGATPEQQNAHNDEKPVHQVKLSSYMIGKTEVTQELWQAVMGENPSHNKGENLPVEHVSWNDCQTFINKLNAMTGENFRLPTEAEWEYAARGMNRSKRTQYSGSANIDEVAWYTDNSEGKTHPVATKVPNELGIYDMTGNVWEWCQDFYDSSYYKDSPSQNPTGPSEGSYRTGRGGGWGGDAGRCRMTFRTYDAPENYSDDLGFRLALTGPTESH